MRFIILFLFFMFSFTPAQKNEELAREQQAIETLKKEIEALKKIKLDKTNQLEKKETIRWQNRYAQNQAGTEYQNETRALEGRYTKVSDDISRTATELGALRNLTTEQKEKANAAKNGLNNFHLLVKQAVDKSIEEIPMDFPAKIEERLLNFANNPPDIEIFFKDKFLRLNLTQTQELTIKDSYRLRLGTVFYAEAKPDSSNVNAVLRTGAIKGKVFEWYNTFPKELAAEIKQSVLEVQKGESSAWVPLDVLQTKAIVAASTNITEQTYLERFTEWFKTGGIVMYPLFLLAIAALFISLEKGFVLWKWGHISKTFTKKLHVLIKNNQLEEAKKLCKKQKTCLGYVLGVIVDNSQNKKALAQKYLQEALMSEQSSLEKRMSFLAALGTVAPLLGLLGTVAGMITLFTVITQAGTNDARILAGGISEALITTETGLIIAIPVMLLHGKLSETLDYITTELRVQSLSLFNIFWKE